MNKQLLYLLVMSMVCAAPQEAHANTSDLLRIGAFAGGVIGLGVLANWLLSESDEQVVFRAEDVCRDVHTQYASILDVYESVAYAGYDENGLYSIACIIWDTGKTQSTYHSSVHSAKNILRSLRDTLHNRSRKLSASHDYQSRALVVRMQESLRYIDRLLPRIESFANYLTKHSLYFDLYEADGRIRNTYQALMDEVALYRHDGYQVVAVIKRHAAHMHGIACPLTKFAGTLQKDVDTLKSLIRRADARYYNRISCAQQLIDTLAHLLSMLCSDPAYAQEYNDREYHRREQERLELQRKQARLERERLQREQERLDLERERLRRDRRRESKAEYVEVDPDVRVSLNVRL